MIYADFCAKSLTWGPSPMKYKYVERLLNSGEVDQTAMMTLWLTAVSMRTQQISHRLSKLDYGDMNVILQVSIKWCDKE